MAGAEIRRSEVWQRIPLVLSLSKDEPSPFDKLRVSGPEYVGVFAVNGT
jgi:hypothetical protein